MWQVAMTPGILVLFIFGFRCMSSGLWLDTLLPRSVRGLPPGRNVILECCWSAASHGQDKDKGWGDVSYDGDTGQGSKHAQVSTGTGTGSAGEMDTWRRRATR